MTEHAPFNCARCTAPCCPCETDGTLCSTCHTDVGFIQVSFPVGTAVFTHQGTKMRVTGVDACGLVLAVQWEPLTFAVHGMECPQDAGKGTISEDWDAP